MRVTQKGGGDYREKNCFLRWLWPFDRESFPDCASRAYFGAAITWLSALRTLPADSLSICLKKIYLLWQPLLFIVCQ